MPKPTLRKKTKFVPLTKLQYRERFFDPEFDSVRAELEKVFEVAWDGYITYRKSHSSGFFIQKGFRFS